MKETIYSFCEIVVNKETVVLNILDENTVIGAVTYNQTHNELYNLFVDVKHRNQGVAKTLLKEAVFRYQPKYITASSGYESDVVRLVKLYQSVGFTVDNVHMTRNK